MHGLAVYVKEGLLRILIYVFGWLYLIQCFTSFSYIDHLLHLYARFLMLLLSNTEKVLSIYTSANVFVFGDLNVHHKDWLTCSGATDSVIIFLSQMTLLR